MKRNGATDHLSSSLTDLMTSLMVIFILLLVSKLNNQAGERAAVAEYLQRQLQNRMAASQQQNHVGRDRDDPNTVVIEIPDKLINFDPMQASLKPEGRAYLERHVPAWAGVLCSAEIRPNIDTIVVEGHSDGTQWQGSSYEESKEKNLALSQQRSMAVVSTSINLLKQAPAYRDCFLEKLSATGRGEEDLADKSVIDSPKNRRVVFKIRLRPDLSREVAQSLQPAMR